MAHEGLQLRVKCSSGRAQELESIRTRANVLREDLQKVRDALLAAEDRAKLQQQLNSKVIFCCAIRCNFIMISAHLHNSS